MSSILIAFRGRNTDAIIRDSAVTAEHTVIICRPGDSMAESGDMSPEQFWASPLWREIQSNFHKWDETTATWLDWRITLIANGGTTAQLVPVLLALENTYIMVGDDYDRRGESEYWLDYTVLDVQRDGPVRLR